MPNAMAGEKPRPTASASPGSNAPPSAKKVVLYQVWFLAILLLEYALVGKAVILFKAYETRSVVELKLLNHRWVSMAVHVVIDAVVLWFLNAFPGVPNTGLARQSENDAARDQRQTRATFRGGAAETGAARSPRRLRVPQHAPLLARHALKLFIRVPTISSMLLGSSWRLYHGYTQKQTQLMVLSPTFFNVAFGGKNRAYLAAQSTMNAVFVLAVSYLNPDAYALYPDTLRRDFLDACGDHSTFYTVVLPLVVAAPFVFAYLLQHDAAVKWLELMWRVYFGEQAQLGKESELEPTPRMMRRVAGRLRLTAKRLMPLASSLTVGAVAHARFTSLDDAFDAFDAPSNTCIALAAACLAASVTVPGKLSDAFSASPEGLRDFHENVRNGTEKTAFKIAASYAATSALACALVTRGTVRGIPTRAVTSVAVNAWLSSWGIVASFAFAATFSPGAPRAARAAAAAVAVAAAGTVVIDPRAIENFVTFAHEQKTNCATALCLAYLCALHAAYVWTVHANMFFEDAPGEADKEAREEMSREATKSGLPGARKGHWQPEDFEIDPCRFKVRPRDRDRSLDDARDAYAPLARSDLGGARHETAFEGLCEPSASARGVSMCRAEGCGKPAESGYVLTEGLSLCAEHLVAAEPFQCDLCRGAAHFCVLCRRVHAPPRCFGADERPRFPHSLLGSIDEIIARDFVANNQSARSRTRHGDASVSMRAWYKTEEGPVEATARVRDAVREFAALRPGNARVLHAEVAARPGCTLLSVDVGALIDEDAGSIAGSDRDDDGDTTSSDRARVEDIARALSAVGVRNGLDGVLDFEITGGALRRMFRRFTFDGRERTSTSMELETAPHFADFARFRRFGLFGAESAPRGDEDGANGGVGSRADDRLPVLRSDRYDVLALPTAPEGYVYVIRCGGTYLPLLAPGDTDRADTCMLHAPPSHAEGLGFVELIAAQELEARDIDLTEGPVDVSGRVDISPLLSTAVFITPSARLATELGDPVTGARAKHAPMLFNIGATLTGRASGAVVGVSGTHGNAGSSGDLDDSERVREEAVFHAACGAASMGWSVVTTRVLANLGVQNNWADAPDGAGWLTRDDHAAAMSENPDTATDEYDYSSEYSSDGAGGRRVSHRGAAKARILQTLGTLSGAATLMRAACSSGDASTSRVVVAWVIQTFGLITAGDLLLVGDGGGVGKDWTPLHAAAFAVASRARKPEPRESRLASALATVDHVVRGAERSISADLFAAVDEVIGMLSISGDPLSWARHSAASAAAPSAVLRDGGDAGRSASSRIAAWRARRERVALDERILRTLAEATRAAVATLRSVTTPGKPLPAHEHFAAAAAFAAFAFDGSRASTMTVAALSPKSSRSWDALRARALDDARGDVSSEEAMEWLRAGAPSDGFPVPSAEEIMARDVGVAASVFCAAIDAAIVSSVIASRAPTRALGEEGPGALETVGAALSQWLAPAACACARAAATPSKRRGSARRATNARVRLVGAAAQVLVARVTNRILIGSARPALAACAVRCASVFAQAVAAPCGSFARETACVALGVLACAALVVDPRGRSLLELSRVAFHSTLIATLVARGARWCVPRVARRRVDKLAAERMAAFEGEAKKTR